MALDPEVAAARFEAAREWFSALGVEDLRQRAVLAAATVEPFVTRAARLAEVAPGTVYRWLQKDDAFKEAWGVAESFAVEDLETEAWARAMAGASDKASASLLTELLRAYKAKYRRAGTSKDGGGGNVTPTTTIILHGGEE
jgi:hypothetical protein